MSKKMCRSGIEKSMLYISPLFAHCGVSRSDRPRGPFSLMTSLFGLMTATSDVNRPGRTPNTSVVIVGVSVVPLLGM